jgi:NTE family protein
MDAAPHDDTPASLVLGGGVALGAFQAGAFERLANAPLAFRSVSGASIGAINAAIIVGNAPSGRVAALRQFWDKVSLEAAPGDWLDPWGWSEVGALRRWRNWSSVVATALLGNPGLFAPRALGNGRGEGRSLYDNQPVAATLGQVIDFDRINSGEVRLCIACTDVERGEPIFFDTARGDRIGPEHIIASSSLLPAFEPVRIDGRLLGDGGMACNLPLEAEIGPQRRGAPEPLCIAIDLFTPEGKQHVPLNRVVERSIDVMFGMQTRMRLAGLEREWALAEALAAAVGEAPDARPEVDLLLMSYRGAETDAGFGKPFDFSPATLADRWTEGAAAAERALRHVAPGEPRSGLRVHHIG